MSYRSAGLASAWEGTESLRVRIREHGKLLMHPKTQKIAAMSIQNAKMNKYVLLPALQRLRLSGGKLPAVDALISQCEELYGRCAREVASDTSAKDGWTLRRLLSWMKRKAKRQEVSNDCG